jgi:hypothetical protein
MNLWQILLTFWLTGWAFGCVAVYFRAKYEYTKRRELLRWWIACLFVWFIALYIAWADWEWLDRAVGSKKK